jgi:tRNA G46 methylase TrmB
MSELSQLSKKLVKRAYRQNCGEEATPTREELKEFQIFADKHNFLGSEGWFLPEHKEYRKVLSHIKSDDVVLDIGAGNFALDLLLAEKCTKVYAIEVNPKVVSDALKIIGYNQPRNLVIICANGLDFPVPKDVNTLVMLLRHFSQTFPEEWQDIPKIIAQIYGTWIIVDSKEKKEVF